MGLPLPLPLPLPLLLPLLLPRPPLLPPATGTPLRGMPMPPREVRLEAHNFHVRLRWEPDPRSGRDATYRVEWRGRTSRWTRARSCVNSTGPPWACELYFGDIHGIYWARVRAVAGGASSAWAYSGELQPYRDTTVGPPQLSWLLRGHVLSVSVSAPLTPYLSRRGSYKPVDRVLLKLWYWLSLREGDVVIQQVPCRQSRRDAPCSFGHLKPRTRYCVRTAAAGLAEARSREAEQCLVTPAGPPGFPWVLLAVLSGVSLLLLVAGLIFIRLHVVPGPSERHLPKTLAVLNGALSATGGVPPLELKEDALALLLPTAPPPCGPPAAEQTPPAVQPLLGESLSRGASGYCPNGFGPDCHEGGDPSCPHGQPGCAVGSRLSTQLGEDEDAQDGDDAPEQPEPAGLTSGSCAGDGGYGEYRTPEPWLSLQLQPCSGCPALPAGSCPPLPTPGRCFRREDLQESLGAAGRWVPLSSVKLPAGEEENGGQLARAAQPPHGHGTEPGDSPAQHGHLERAAPGGPGPGQPPPFSGYELRHPADAEP